MHMRRQVSRLFSSLRRKKPKEPTEGKDSGTALSNKFSSFRSSLRLKRKENSTSRCQLLDDDILTSDKENPIDSTLGLESLKEVSALLPNLTSADEKFEVQVDVCQREALLSADADEDDDDVNRILFEDQGLRPHWPSLKVVGNDSPERITRTDMEVNRNYPQMKVNDADDGITHKPTSLSNEAQKCSACRRLEGISTNGASTATACMSSSGNSNKRDPNLGNPTQLSTASNNALVIKNHKKKLTLGEVRRSAKRVRKALKVGFVNWAESMSYHYSSAVIPEFYEYPAMTSIDCHYTPTEAPWYPHHYHYSVRDRYSYSLNPNPNPNQICHCSL